MKRPIILLEIVGLMLCAFGLYVFAPIAREAVQSHLRPAAKPEPVAQTMTVTPPPTTEPARQPGKTADDGMGTIGEPSPCSPRWWSIPEAKRPPAKCPPLENSQTISLLPGQYAKVHNADFRRIELHAEYPVRVVTAQCHNDYAVEFECLGDPEDIFISDVRPRPIFTTPKANTITLKEMNY